MKTLITGLAGILRFRKGPAIIAARSVGAMYTKDAAQAYQYRMPAGFPGDVNRTHPVSIEPATPDPTNPPAEFGIAGLIDATSGLFRKFLAGDTAVTDMYGLVARPWPTQQQTTTNYGAAVFGGDGPGNINKLDIMRSGYMMVRLNNFAAAPSKKGGAVFVWCAATAGANTQGRLSAAASGGNTAAMNGRILFNGAPDSQGNVEVSVYP